MKNNLSKSVILLILFTTFSGCNSINIDPYSNTPTSGKIRICADETFKNIIEAELGVFHALYTYSDIQASYVPENELFKELINDSVDLIIASRYLEESEIKQLNDRKIFPKQIKIAIDGIALIVNPGNSLPGISLKELREIFTGEITQWNQLSQKGNAQEISIVFDNQQSSIIRMAIDSVCKGQPLSKKVYAMDFNQDVLSYVARTTSALGLIGVSWISDRDDSLQLSFLKGVNVLAVSRDSVATPDNSYKPFQAYLSEGLYPLTRDIIIINAEPRAGLATGFTSFIASDKGQRIILKTGILPAITPTRLVNVRENF